jgi:hypothetical protein
MSKKAFHCARHCLESVWDHWDASKVWEIKKRHVRGRFEQLMTSAKHHRDDGVSDVVIALFMHVEKGIIMPAIALKGLGPLGVASKSMGTKKRRYRGEVWQLT